MYKILVQMTYMERSLIWEFIFHKQRTPLLRTLHLFQVTSNLEKWWESGEKVPKKS